MLAVKGLPLGVREYISGLFSAFCPGKSANRMSTYDCSSAMTLVKNTSSMGKRDKGRKVSQTVAAPPKQAGSSSKNPGPSSIDKGKGKAKVSDELRQAVKDLGGDDEDLDLIAGVDSDGEESAAAKVPKSSTSGSEVGNLLFRLVVS